MNKLKTVSILGSGWLGLPLAECLIANRYQVKLSTRSTARFPELQSVNAKAYSVDIDHLIDISDFLQSECLIINITSKNLTGFAQLIQQIEQSPVKQVLFVSSTSVYKNLQKVVTENEGAENDQSVLFQIERLFLDNIDFVCSVVRLSGLTGGNRHPGNFFRTGKVVAQPDAPVNLIHREDCLGIILAIIEQAAWGETFNACADSHPSKREFYTYTRKLLNQPAPEFLVNSENAYKIVSNHKVKQILGYQFVHADLMAINF